MVALMTLLSSGMQECPSCAAAVRDRQLDDDLQARQAGRRSTVREGASGSRL
jgi:hypothetical protein